jgi:hypothetical protein
LKKNNLIYLIVYRYFEYQLDIKLNKEGEMNMKTTRKSKPYGHKDLVSLKLHGFKQTEEQFGLLQDFEMAAGFYDARDSWNQMLIKTMSNMRLSCQFFS